MEQITNVHDRFFRETFGRRDIAQGFLETYLPEDIRKQTDLRTLRIRKDSFVDKELREHFSDILYTVRFAGAELFLYLLFEHKSYPDMLTAFQLLRYIVKLWELYLKQNKNAQKLPPVLPMLLYHGRTEWNIPGNFRSLVDGGENPALKRYIPEFEYHIFDISHLPDEEIRGRIFSRMVLLTAKYVFRPDLREKLPEILSLFREVADRDTALEMLEILLRYVVRATGSFGEKDVQEILSKTDMGEGIMQTFIDKYIHQGREQGQIQLLMKMMEKRFGTLPQQVKEKIESADSENIEKWSLRLLSAQRPEEVVSLN